MVASIKDVSSIKEVVSINLIGKKEESEVKIEEMRIAVQFKDQDTRDRIVNEGKQRARTKNSIRCGRTPDEIKKNIMFRECAIKCEAENARLSGEERKIWVYRPIMKPGSEKMFEPVKKDIADLQQKRKEWEERQALKQHNTRQ